MGRSSILQLPATSSNDYAILTRSLLEASLAAMRRCFALALVLAAAGGGACVDIHGGAVDLSWTIFGPNGQACCPNGNFCKAAGDGVRVRVQLHRDTCETESTDRLFACEIVQGATPFDISPDGTYCIAVDAIDQTGAVVATGPGPVLRDIARGDVVELGAVALTVSECPSPCP